MNNQPATCESRSGNYTIRANRLEGASPTVVFCGGFRSDMSGTKAMALDAWCRQHEQGYVRFDYAGHGISDGQFESTTIGQWLQDTISVIDTLTTGPLVLVGSSMGGWIMLLAALQRPERIAGLVGIASAPDFTERLIWDGLDDSQRQALQTSGQLELPSDYLDDPTIISNELIVEGRNHLLLDGPLEIPCPARLLHSLDDPDVPWQLSLEIQQGIKHGDVNLTLLKDAGHRLSRPEDIQLILATTAGLIDQIR